MANSYDRLRHVLLTALDANTRCEHEACEAHDLLWRCLEVINEQAETALSADVRAFLGAS